MMKRSFSIVSDKSRLFCGAAVALAAFVLANCSAPASKDASAAKPGAKVAAVKEPEDASTTRHLHLLTSAQYLNTVSYALGPDVRPEAEARFAPTVRTDGLLQVGTTKSGVNDTQVEVFQKVAVAVATTAMDPGRRKFLMPCVPKDEKAADAACATQFVTRVGRLMFRRPLPADKVAELVGQANAGADRLKDFYAGLGIAIEAILVSPKTLFVAEAVEPDPTRPGQQRLDAYSLASRLSFFLWNAGPDEAVLKAAESGEIHTAKGRAKLVDMMLASPRLEAGMRAFFDDMLGFDELSTLAKDATVYPAFTGATVEDAHEQTLRTMVDHLLVKNRDYRDLFTSRDTFLSPVLGALYNLPTRTGWMAYTFPDGSPRTGFLTQISFLAGHSHPGRSSPTLRGKALREILLCQPVPRPPANVDFSIVENPNPNLHTARDRLELHRKNPVCAGCHKITDPMGLALENFDGAGQFRDNEKGWKIDTSGTLDGRAFKDVAGLGQAMHDHTAVPACMVKRVFAYGTGGSTDNQDQDELAYYGARFAEQGYRLKDLLRTVALSNAFSTIRETPPAVKAADAASAESTTNAK